MAIFGFRKLSGIRNPAVPENIPRPTREGGRLSTYGGPSAAVEYRLHIKTADGREFIHIEPDLEAIIIAWRRFTRPKELEYYTNVSLPIAVIYDSGLKGYREVYLDMFENYLRNEKLDWYDKYMLDQEAKKAADKAAAMARLKEAIAQATALPEREEVSKKHAKKTKSGQKKPGQEQQYKYTAETISPLQRTELQARQRGEPAEEEDEVENPKNQTMREFIRQNREEIDRIIERRLGGKMPYKNDEERRQWILNDEGLYTWARMKIRGMNPRTGFELPDSRHKNPHKRKLPSLSEIMKPTTMKCMTCGGVLHVIPYRVWLHQGKKTKKKTFRIETLNICGRCSFKKKRKTR